MDTLSDVLSLIRLKGCVYFLRGFCAPWGMAMGSGPVAQFHLVVRGQCWLRVGGDTRVLSSGDVVTFPFGDAHSLLDDPTTVPVPGIEVLQAHRARQPIFQGAKESAQLLCGHFEFDREFKHALVEELPRLIHITGMSSEQPGWLDMVMNVLVREAGSDQPGAATVVDRLAEVLFVQVLRAYLLQTRPTHGFLAVLRDQRLNHALKVIHRRAHTDLSLAAIARAAGMSRSNLAVRFKEVLGTTPMSYLTSWRMLKARELLKSPGASLADVAHGVGYKSEAAFGRAFKRQFEQGPGAFRRLSLGEHRGDKD